MSRNQEQRHVYYEHDFYVIGFIKGGQRHLWYRDREYDLRSGDFILFNLRDSHYCSPIGGELLNLQYQRILPLGRLQTLRARRVTEYEV